MGMMALIQPPARTARPLPSVVKAPTGLLPVMRPSAVSDRIMV